MTCDDFFDDLTSTSSLSEKSARHLEECPRCRDLQEALFPALTVLQDVTANESEQFSSQTPLDANRVVTTAHQLAIASALQLSQKHRPSRHLKTSNPWRYAVAFFSGVAIALMIAAMLTPNSALSASAALPVNQPVVCDYQQTTEQRASDRSVGTVILSCFDCHLSEAEFTAL